MKTDILTEEDIQKMVLSFYSRVENNERLNYIFNDFAKVNWEDHLPKMFDFWSNVVFGTGRYRGNPYREHLPLPIVKNDFIHWFSLFEETVLELFEGENAKIVVQVAMNVANMFRTRMDMAGKFDLDSVSNEK
ncbi:MAG: group III truncated hemoglobin [Bacteroidetes bacterium]|nr:group III truncated hemoglobin [Bacteroidota bacterium]